MVGTILGSVALAVAAAGCTTQFVARQAMSSLLDSGFAAVAAETDTRIAESAAATSLKIIDGLLADDPQNQSLLLRGAQGYASYAAAFADGGRAAELYLRARDYGLRALGQRRRAAPDQWGDVRSMSAYLARLDRGSVPVVYWTAAAWAAYLSIIGDQEQLRKEQASVMAMVEFVITTNERYQYGGAHLAAGSLLADTPADAGGDMGAARNHFERSIALTGGAYLPAYVRFAQSVAIRAQNRTLFDTLLTRVTEAPLGALPEQGLANAVARATAASLAASAADLFPP